MWDQDNSNADTGNFWEDLTNTLLGSGQRYFFGQQQSNADLAAQKQTNATITSVVKFIALTFAGIAAFKIIVSLFKKR